MLYPLSLQSVICNLYHNKAGKRKNNFFEMTKKKIKMSNSLSKSLFKAQRIYPKHPRVPIFFLEAR